MFNRLDRLNRLRRASHLDAQMSKFATPSQKPATQKEFLNWCVYIFEEVGECKIQDAKILGDNYTFKGTTEVNMGRGVGKVEKPIEIGLGNKGLTFQWRVNVGTSSYEDKETYESPFQISQVPEAVLHKLLMLNLSGQRF